MRRVTRRITVFAVIALAIAVIVGAIILYREIRYQQRSARVLDQAVDLMRQNQRFQSFDEAMRDRGFTRIDIASDQGCGFDLTYYPPGSRCIRYSGHDVQMDFIVTPEGRVATVVPGWD